MNPIIVSACLTGVHCRYDQRHCLDKEIEKMMKHEKVIPVCPEQLGGLPTPRNPAEIVGGSGEDVLDGKARVVDSKGKDVTQAFLRGAYETLQIAQLTGAKRAILKEASPSCGSCLIYDGTFQGKKKPGRGVTVALLQRHGIEVTSEKRNG